MRRWSIIGRNQRWWKWSPWVLGAFGLAFTALVVASRINAEQERVDADLVSLEAQFVEKVTTVERSIAVEQSKLIFLVESVAAWTVSAESGDQQFGMFVQSLGLDEKTPAISAVSIVEFDGTRAEVVLSSTPGDDSSSALVGLDLGARLGVADLLERSIAESTVVVGIPVDVHGFPELALARQVRADTNRHVVLTFQPDVFLMPALLTAQGVQPVLVPRVEPGDPGFPIVGPPPPRPARLGGRLASEAGRPDGRAPFPEWARERVALDGNSSDMGMKVVSGAGGGRLVSVGHVEIFDQGWYLGAATEPGTAPRADYSDSWVLAAAGVALSILAFLVACTLVRLASQQTAFAEELRLSNRRFATGFENAPIGMAEVTSNGSFIRVNGAMTELLGYSSEELTGQSLFDLVHPDDQDAHQRRISGVLDGSARASHTEVRYWTKGGSERRIDESLSALEQEGERHLLVQAKDVTRQREVERELMQKALHDELTGLPNRALLFDRLRQAIDGDPESSVGVLFIDLDQFKLVNDSLGHTAGDRLLTVAADRVLGCVADSDTVARFGGDEFVVVCAGDDHEATLAKAGAILEALKRPIDLLGTTVRVTASVGAAFVSPMSSSPESLLRDADAAMYRAKESGRDRVEVFDAALRLAAAHRLDLESALRRAIEEREFRLHYQPIMALGEGEIVGFEALVRWEHPQRGMLRPDEFIAVAEEAGLLEQMDLETLRVACAQFATWSVHPTARRWRLSVNCSSRWFEDTRLLDALPGVLAEAGLAPERLCLEITERALVEDAERSREVIAGIRELGVSVAIDDFGTGYSSLSYLSQLSVDHLKIDRAFVESLTTDEGTAAIVGAVVEMAGALGIPTTAEGIEEGSQLAAVRDLGVGFAQGNYVAEPLSVREIERALEIITERDIIDLTEPVESHTDEQSRSSSVTMEP